MGDAFTVDVRLGARLGPGTRRVRLAPGATVADLLDVLAADLGLAPGRTAAMAVAVAGEVVGGERVLRDGQAVTVVLPVAGG